MKRSTLACTIAGLLSIGQASAAVTLDAGGLGQGLLFPFFTTQNGQTTLISIQNDSPDAKALKVRIMEGHAGAETLTFNVYLREGARWSAALALPDESADAPGSLITNSKACTIPVLDGPVALRTFAFEGDGGPQTPARTRRGFVEVIEMGTLVPSPGSWGGPAEFASFPDEYSCGELVDLMSPGGIWLTSPNEDLGAPSGGLRGDAVVMDTSEGTSFGYPALAFDGLATMPRQFALAGADADLLSPRLTDIPADEDGEIRVVVAHGPGASTTLRYPADRAYDAIGALLASTSAAGNYNIHPAVAARSEWVLSFPTRRVHLADVVDGGAPAPGVLPQPFSAGSDCETFQASLLNEQGFASFLPHSRALDVCGSVAVVQFFEEYFAGSFSLDGIPGPWDGSASNRAPIFVDPLGSVFADSHISQLPIDAAVGSVQVDLGSVPTGTRHGGPDLEGKCWVGMPVWVWRVQTSEHANAQPGRIASFPDARPASRTFQIVDCATLDD